MDGDLLEENEEETVAQKLLRFWQAGYVFSKSEIKVLRELSRLHGYYSPGYWRTKGSPRVPD